MPNTDDELTKRAALMRLFDETRKKLVETGTRNRLIHVNRGNSRGKVINIVNERSDDVYSILSNGKNMRFLAIGRDKHEIGEPILVPDVGDVNFNLERFTDAQLETRMGPDALQKRLLKIANEARTAEEESGVNILYLALGFLKWFEDKTSAVAREAPLVLLPVELVRNQKTSTYDICLRDEEALTNLPLQQRLKEDFGISLPELEIGEGWIPSSYFGQVKEVVASRNNWEVDEDAMQLGFFSFSKLLMYRDLAIDSWPDGAIAKHLLTRGLLYEGFEPEVPLLTDSDRLDDVLTPDKVFHVVDADASQSIVIEEVRNGRNLVVQGPPGTGKSQTITNIIAAAAQQGKRVLFVAEKMAALSVVHDRLVKVGLSDICLELHSRNVNKKVVLNELSRTLSAATTVPAKPLDPQELAVAKNKLNRISDELHKPIGSSNESAFHALGTQSLFIGRGSPPPTIDAASLALLTGDQIEELVGVAIRYGEILQSEGNPDSHPFAGTGNLELQPVDIVRVERILQEAIDSAISLSDALQRAANALGITTPSTRSVCDALIETLGVIDGLPQGSESLARLLLANHDLPRIADAINGGVEWKSSRDKVTNIFMEAAFDMSPTQLRGPIVHGTQSFFARWGSAYRQASRELASVLRETAPKLASERLRLVDQLIQIESARAKWAGDEAYCVSSLAEWWRSDLTDFAKVGQAVQWCMRVKAAPIKVSSETLITLASQAGLSSRMKNAIEIALPISIKALNELNGMLELDKIVSIDEGVDRHVHLPIEKMKSMQTESNRYSGWVALNKLHAQVVEAGIPDVAQRLRSGELDASSASVEIRFGRAERLWNLARSESNILRDISAEDRHKLVTQFAELERLQIRENVSTILSSHFAQVPQGAVGEMKIVRGEIGKKRGHISLRKLFSTAGNALQRIKPVMLMSPISVAQYIPPGALEFDLLVIDEASQVRPEDALGSIARAKQIVVVGDQKQLPPSSFFDRLLNDEDQEENEEDSEDNGSLSLLSNAAKVGEMESVLSLCEARGLASRMLRWHYRSRDPSLIQVSNAEFYNDDLVLPPSPLQMDPNYGLCFTKVAGVYDKGGKRDNRIEGEAIVRRVADLAATRPDISLGIVTFSSAQKSLITELLEIERRANPVLNEFLREGQSESVFVKNIENVQGDERDVILISVGYGPTIAGGRLTSMSFGPVNLEGGERRLNVLFTRARIRCEVFASFDPGDIDVSRSKSDGVRILKRFLDFANGTYLSADSASDTGADSPFEEDVAEVIRSLGYIADPQVGSAGFRIDIGVRHPERPGTYLMAVECDGATYHSALWARERDRLRQEVLEHLGWNFHRIWSTDWFYRRNDEIIRLREALAAAKEITFCGIAVSGANKDKSAQRVQVDVAPKYIEVPETPIKKMPAYQRAHFPISTPHEPHEVETSVLSGLAIRIVEHEGPIHEMEAARRLAACFGKEKAGARIVSSTRAALSFAQSKNIDLLTDGTFWFMRQHVDSPQVRDRSEESGPPIKAENISMIEIRAALDIARDDNVSANDDDLIRVAARLMGFKRVGSDLQERLASGLFDKPS